jgi:hypothetical protein
MNLVSPSTVARNRAVVLISTAMGTSVHSSRPIALRFLRASTILDLSAHLRLSTTADRGKSIVPIAPPLNKSTFFAHGEKRNFSSRTRGLAQPDV